jgi:hypothetical protein
VENWEAIIRLRKRGDYLQSKIEQLTAEGKPTFWFEKDLASIQIATAAVQYVIDVEIYEQSQQSSALESSSG